MASQRIWEYQLRETRKKEVEKQLTKQTIFESYVRCHLNYCNIVWGAKKNDCMTELKTTTKRIWKNSPTCSTH
jgi:hypothetical protein